MGGFDKLSHCEMPWFIQWDPINKKHLYNIYTSHTTLLYFFFHFFVSLYYQWLLCTGHGGHGGHGVFYIVSNKIYLIYNILNERWWRLLYILLTYFNPFKSEVTTENLNPPLVVDKDDLKWVTNYKKYYIFLTQFQEKLMAWEIESDFRVALLRHDGGLKS